MPERSRESKMVVKREDYEECSPQLVKPAIRSLVCPRCDSRLHRNYDEITCLQCGHVDYNFMIHNAHHQKNMMSTATRFVLRYIGDFPQLTDRLTHVQLRRYRNRAIYAVTCPFCNAEMEQSSLSGKRREVREERYKCTDGHRISLMPGKNSELGWK